jgi:hypothetical protein
MSHVFCVKATARPSLDSARNALSTVEGPEAGQETLWLV